MSPPVASPCVGVCVLDAASVCRGCGRHIDEIAGWSRLGEDARRAVVAGAAARMERLGHAGRILERTA